MARGFRPAAGKTTERVQVRYFLLEKFIAQFFFIGVLADFDFFDRPSDYLYMVKVHKTENFFGSDFEFCTISLLVKLKYLGFVKNCF
jgi:hypothetical protein